MHVCVCGKEYLRKTTFSNHLLKTHFPNATKEEQLMIALFPEKIGQKNAEKTTRWAEVSDAIKQHYEKLPQDLKELTNIPSQILMHPVVATKDFSIKGHKILSKGDETFGFEECEDSWVFWSPRICDYVGIDTKVKIISSRVWPSK